VYLSRRTRRRYNSGIYRITADTAFDAVVAGCAGPRQYDAGTWITADMRDAYATLHRMGHAHSLEVWVADELCGGIYGLSIGSVFFGESMFSRRTDASKIALVALCRQLHAWGYGLLDCQVGNPHLFRMGAVQLGREAFEEWLEHLVEQRRDAAPWTDRVQFEQRW
jgi:leucyl/phenylalanyl-tRNA--protein transferase